MHACIYLYGKFVGALQVIHQSPTTVQHSKGSVPLYCIASCHSLDYKYEWKSGLDVIPWNTPVLWVSVPGTYSCTVSADGLSCKSKCITVESVHIGMLPDSYRTINLPIMLELIYYINLGYSVHA